jgi:hypothetical protein
MASKLETVIITITDNFEYFFAFYIMVHIHTNATNLTTKSSENVSSRKKLYAKKARLN